MTPDSETTSDPLEALIREKLDRIARRAERFVEENERLRSAVLEANRIMKGATHLDWAAYSHWRTKYFTISPETNHATTTESGPDTP